MASPVQQSWPDAEYDEGFSGHAHTYEPLYHREQNNGVNIDQRGIQLRSLHLPSSDLSQVKTLLLDNNAFSEIPAVVSHMQSLNSLSMSCQVDLRNASKQRGPCLETVIESSPLMTLSNLKSLNMSYNGLSELPSSFRSLKQLEHLDLRLNQFKVFPEVICRMASLSTVVMSGNFIQDVPSSIESMTGLQSLHLGNNYIEKLTSRISRLVNLHTLVLRNNNLHILPQKLNMLKKLVNDGSEPAAEDDDYDHGLILDGNPLVYPPLHVCQMGTTAIFDYLSTAKRDLLVDVRWQRLKDLRDLVRQHPGLEMLDARENMVSELPEELTQCQNIHTLILDKNKFTSFPHSVLAKLNLLHILSMRMMTLFEIPAEISLCKSVTELYLENTQIKNLPSSLVCLKALRILDVKNNELSEVPECVFKLVSLEGLFLGENQLKIIPSDIGNLGNLKVLSLSKNLLEYIPEKVCNLKNIMYLSLRKNRLKYLPPSIDHLGKLAGQEEFSTIHNKVFHSGLHVDDNKDLVLPPSDIWSQGVPQIFDFFRTEKKDNPEYLWSEIRKLRGKKVLTEMFLLDLAGDVGKEFKQLGVYLGISSARLDHVQYAFPNDLHNQIFEMLKLWRRENHHGSGQSEELLLSKLRSALLQMKRKDLVDKYLDQIYESKLSHM